MKRKLITGISGLIIMLNTSTVALNPANAQTHYELNGGFENGHASCGTPNYADYLKPNPANGYVYATNWTGYNPISPADWIATSSMHDITATCPEGAFYSSGITPYAGNRSILIYSEMNMGATTAEGQAIGDIIPPTCTFGRSPATKYYQICLAALNYYPPFLAAGAGVEVTLRSSTGAVADKVALSISMPANQNWYPYTGVFPISLSESGKYDKVIIRMTGTPPSGGYQIRAFIDNFEIITYPDGQAPVSYNCTAQTPSARMHHSTESVDGAIVKILQNPVSNGRLYLQFRDDLAIKDLSYEISDMQGRKIMSGQPDDYLYWVDISALAPGMYIIHGRAGDDDAVIKFLLN